MSRNCHIHRSSLLGERAMHQSRMRRADHGARDWHAALSGHEVCRMILMEVQTKPDGKAAFKYVQVLEVSQVTTSIVVVQHEPQIYPVQRGVKPFQ